MWQRLVYDLSRAIKRSRGRIRRVRRSTKKLMNHKQRRLVGSKEQDTARTILG